MKQSIGELPPRGEKVWFIIKDGAHEGPYALSQLELKSSHGDMLADAPIWARGWPAPLPLSSVLMAYQKNEEVAPSIVATSEPIVEAQVTPTEMAQEPVQIELPKKVRWPYILAGFVLLLGWWVSTQLKMQTELVRPADVTLERFRELKSMFEKFTEAVPLPHVTIASDYSKIWLVDRSNQQCTFEGSFYSSADQNLSGGSIHFQVFGVSAQHWVLFDRLNFVEGQKLIPGRYRMNIERRDCQAKGVLSFWQKADQDLRLAHEVDIYLGDPLELGQRLKELAQKKLQESKQSLLKNRQAWRDIEEKLRTLSAISLQIEQNFQELLNRKFPWDARLKRVIDLYTLRFGGFLTNFMVQNDADFNLLATQDLPQKVDIMGRQSMINTFGKRLGFVSMSLIEKLQKDKSAPNRRDLQDWLQSLSQDMGVEREKLKLAAQEAQALSIKDGVLE